MSNSSYDYLKKYINNQVPQGNKFCSLELHKIEEEEERLGYRFPSQLKEFYLEIGCGLFRRNADGTIYENSYANRLMDPNSVADIKLLGQESGQIISNVEFEPEELPFFEIADGNDFLIMRPQSNKPNAVYGMFGELIEEEFERFIWRLYYESPIYYIENWPSS